MDEWDEETITEGGTRQNCSMKKYGQRGIFESTKERGNREREETAA
jgi:hypothetical protein